MKSDKTMVRVLRNLNPTGHEGFEGLIAKLLEKLTNHRFFLAKSGYQKGRDMSSWDDRGNLIAVECKRYGEKTELKERELLGELFQAHHDNPALDLWVLIASRNIDNQTIDSLKSMGQEFGIEVEAIETNDGEPDSLESLCAYGENILIDHIQKNYSKSNGLDTDKLKSELAIIKSHPDYDKKISRLQQKFSTAEIGYDSWRKTQNQWLIEQFSSAANSRGSFRQVLNVNDKNVKVIERKEAHKQLDNWLNQWEQDKKIFTLLGEEGDGKTWAAALWIVSCIDKNIKLPFLFLNSQDVSTDNIEQMVSESITRQLASHQEEFWKKRILNWMKREYNSRPTIVLVIDGLNENIAFDWRSLIERMQTDPWRNNIALVLTCRTKYWERYFSNLSHIESKTWVLPPYNDLELDAALSKYNLTISNIPQSLLSIVRKPRYLDLTLKHRERMTESGDITLQRLLYEDFKDRLSRKSSHDLTDDDFQHIIIELAEKAVSGKPWFSEQDFAELIPLKKNKGQIIEDLINSGVFVQDNRKKGHFKVESQRLAHGLGLLLYDELSNAAGKGEKAFEECMSSFLEPQPEMDFKAAIVSSSVFHAMLDRCFPESGRLLLMRYWLNLKNLDQEIWDTFPAYFPCCPGIYFTLAEREQGLTNYNSLVEKIIKYTFIKWAGEEKFKDIFKAKCERWLGFVNINGYYIRGKAEERKKYREMLKERLGFELTLGPALFADLPITLIDNDTTLPNLSRIAHALISSYPDRRPFVRAIAINVIANFVTRIHGDESRIQWLLRTSQTSPWPELKREVLKLLDQDNPIASEAAYYLLSYAGNPEAIALRDTLPQELCPQNSMEEEHKKNPCQSFYLWDREHYRKCLERTDIEPTKIAEKMKNLALEPDLDVPKDLAKRLSVLAEKVETRSIWIRGGMTKEEHFLERVQNALYAFSPSTAAKIYRAIIRDIESREVAHLWRFAAALEEYFLILEKEEINIVNKTWERLNKQELNESDRHTEACFFYNILPSLPASMQLRLLTRRPDEADDLSIFFSLFKRLEAGSWDWVLEKIGTTENPEKLWRILWFISKYPELIPQDVLHALEPLLFHDSEIVRRYMRYIAYDSGNKQLIDSYIKRYISLSKNDHLIKKHEGDPILAKFGPDLSYEELKTWISEGTLGFALYQRGLREEDIREYAEDLDRTWQDIKKNCLQTKYKPSGQSHPGWPYEGSDEAFEEVLKRRPDLVKKWTNSLFPESGSTDCMIYEDYSFYYRLCRLLLKHDPTAGAILYRRMKSARGLTELVDGNFKISILLFDLFRARQCGEIIELWNELIDECYIDLDLLEFSIVNSEADNLEWYHRKIDEYLSSKRLYVRGKGIMMLGFLAQTSAYDTLKTLLEENRGCWLRYVIEKAIDHWRHNHWARAWFTRYWESKSDEKAWAAFRLFLECADRRFWLSRKNIMDSFQHTPSFEKRKTFLQMNWSNIRKSIEENEKELKETFLGKKIEKGNIWPWM